MKKLYIIFLLILSPLTKATDMNLQYSESELYFLNPSYVNREEATQIEIIEIRRKLALIDKNIEKFNIEKTPIDGYFKITNGNQKYYVDKDIKHMFLGDAVIFKDGKPIVLNETLDQAQKRLFVQSLNEDDGIIFEAQNEKDRLYVFTDITCPFCNKLHQDIQKINEKGITLVYLPYPRAGLDSNVEKALNKIWCKRTKEEYHIGTVSKKAYISNAINEPADPSKCNKDFTKYYFNVANSMGIAGTPFIINKKGKVLGGYEGYQKFMLEVVKTW